MRLSSEIHPSEIGRFELRCIKTNRLLYRDIFDYWMRIIKRNKNIRGVQPKLNLHSHNIFKSSANQVTVDIVNRYAYPLKTN